MSIYTAHKLPHFARITIPKQLFEKVSPLILGLVDLVGGATAVGGEGAYRAASGEYDFEAVEIVTFLYDRADSVVFAGVLAGLGTIVKALIEEHDEEAVLVEFDDGAAIYKADE